MREWIWRLIRRAFFTFDAELAHRLTFAGLIGLQKFGKTPLHILSGVSSSDLSNPLDRVTVFDLPFANRVGLAAGFDKDALLLEILPDLGFGFAEIGTVTPKPQAGNSRPRLLRDVDSETIWNRMGFNGLGAAVVSQRVSRVRHRLPTEFRIGVNIGKNKATPNEEAAQDYARAIQPFEGLADYVVVNVSSPNTPGLRALQTWESLGPIIDSVQKILGRWRVSPPLLVKFAPDLDRKELLDLILECENGGVRGFVLTNTIGTQRVWGPKGLQPGGMSGRPLESLSRQRLMEVRAVTRLPIISVGGILSTEEALLRIEKDADLIQIYSGWIFRGPSLPNAIVRKIRLK